MEAAHPTAGWEKVGDRFYRKTQLYTAVFDQDLDLDSYVVAGAPYSGAIGTSCVLGLAVPRSQSADILMDDDAAV
jgi:vacuolar protein sorting-associated protein 16